MINYFVTHISGIELFGIVSIVLFFVVFTGAVGCALCLKKPFVNRMSTLPLTDEETTRTTKDTSHE